MSKRLVNEKEIEKNRLEKKWKGVITLVSALNVKNAGGVLSSGIKILLSCSATIIIARQALHLLCFLTRNECEMRASGTTQFKETNLCEVNNNVTMAT